MNNILKNLAGKANFGTIEKGEVVFDKRLEKFAELIINECAELCTKHSRDILKFSQFGSNSAADCAEIIRSHFGVEE